MGKLRLLFSEFVPVVRLSCIILLRVVMMRPGVRSMLEVPSQLEEGVEEAFGLQGSRAFLGVGGVDEHVGYALQFLDLRAQLC